MRLPVTLFWPFLVANWATQTLATPLPHESFNLTFAGVTLPNTPSVIAAHDFVKQHYDAPTYNHVIRGIVFALLIQSKIHDDPAQNVTFSSADFEVITVASLLHDLSWNPYLESTKQFVSPDRRFEVDGAITAREFLTNLTGTSGHGLKEKWDDRRLQLVWDTIALHGTPSLFSYKEPEVALGGYSILLDIVGSPHVTLPGLPAKYAVTQEEFDQVYEAVPSLNLGDYVANTLTGLCLVKPTTTYDNSVGSFGEVYVEGYTLVGTRLADINLPRREFQYGPHSIVD